MHAYRTRRQARRIVGCLFVFVFSTLCVELAGQSPVESSAPSVASVVDFTRSSPASRRHLIRALAHGAPHQAGGSLFPLLNAAVQDRDPQVRHLAIGVVQRVANESERARATNALVITDATTYPPLYQTLLGLIGHPDPAFRGDVIAALAALKPPADETLDAILLGRLVAESPYVRSRIITALAKSADRGSAEARIAVLTALEERDPGVKTSAIKAMRLLRAPEAIPVLLREIELAQHPAMRRTVVQVLAVYGRSLIPYLRFLRESYARELDETVRIEMQKLVSSLEPDRSQRSAN